METLSIGQVAARSGLAVSAIRYYERIGLLPPPSRTGGRRRYTMEVIGALSLIRLGQAAGFTLAELRALRVSDGAGPGDPQWANLLAQKLDATSTAMVRLQRTQRLLAAALNCGCSDITTCSRLEHPL